MKKLLPLLFVAAFCCIALLSCEKEPQPVIPPEETPTDTIPEPDTIPAPDTTPAPTASFRFDQGTTMVVNFINTSTNASSYSWDFGDGSFSTETSPVHAYASIGTKTVTLTAYNGTKTATATAEINMTSRIKMMSISSHPYTIYIDGENNGTINGGGSNIYAVAPGSHTVRVLQESGYAFYATDETYTVTCTAGSTTIQEFPEDSWGK